MSSMGYSGVCMSSCRIVATYTVQCSHLYLFTTIPRFLSSGLMVIVRLEFLKFVNDLREGGVTSEVQLEQMAGSLLSSFSFVC